jgi:glycosyltransferase involved in cell wall biosynthesis
MPFALRVLRHRTPAGPAAGRNTAWRNATAPVVAFTDDDCLPTPAWLAAGLAAIRDGTDFLQGPTRPATRQLADLRGFATTLSVPSENVVYETSNMFYRREVLAALGGFDEAFRYPGGEDMDLGWRAREAGYRSSFAEDAVVEHAVHQRDLLGYLRSFWRFGDVARVLRIHPEARRWLPLRVFLDPEHAWFLLAVAGAVTGWLLSPWVFLACVPYGSMVVHDRAETTSLAIRVLRAPARVIATLGEIVMLLAASARHRSVLL